MRSWQERTLSYFYTLVVLVVTAVILVIVLDSFKYRQIRNSLNIYMNNLSDMIFMSTYDSLKKGNMKLFENHLAEVATFNDVYEFSLIDRAGVVRYSSDTELLKNVDLEVVGLTQNKYLLQGGRSTRYFPVETTSYCSRCHPDWKVGSVNSYYKLTLSSEALDAARQSTLYFHGFTVGGGLVFLAFMYMLFSRYERRKHEEQMHLSASVFEHAVEAMIITSAKGIIEKVNTAFTEMTGFGEEEILGKDIHVLDTGEINNAAHLEMREKLRSDGIWIGEVWNRRKNGEDFPVRLSVTAVRNVKNHVTHFVSIFYDISVRKAAERAMLRMDQVKSEFISTAAHELRTPLSAIMGYSELLRDADDYGFSKEQRTDFLDQVQDRSEALNQIIDDLLDVGRIESGKPIDLKFATNDLFELLRKTIEFYKINDSKHEFVLKLPADNDKSEFLIDRHRVKQVLENLLNNASKYSSEGTQICLSCQFINNTWEVCVEDCGIGMTPEQVEKIFDKFYRADSSDTAVSGFGLGMSVAKQIVEIHGGRIRVQSELNVGTKAVFTLPYVLK